MKTCIDWIDAEKELPEIDTNDRFNSDHEISVRVLVKVVDRHGNEQQESFARYHYNGALWSIHGFLGDFKVTHYAYLG